MLDLGDVKLTGIPARHDANVPGWEVPDAFGALLDFGGVRIYHTGDTDYDPRIHPGVPEICDYVDNNCDGQIDEGTEWILGQMAAQRTVLVTCRAGQGRSVTMVLAALMRLGHTLDELFQGNSLWLKRGQSTPHFGAAPRKAASCAPLCWRGRGACGREPGRRNPCPYGR